MRSDHHFVSADISWWSSDNFVFISDTNGQLGIAQCPEQAPIDALVNLEIREITKLFASIEAEETFWGLLTGRSKAPIKESEQ